VCRRRGDAVTALHVAVRHQLLSVVSILLSHGANVNSFSRYDRRTPLHAAASTGNTDVLRLLVENGASVDQPDIYGSTALQTTVASSRLEAAQVAMFSYYYVKVGLYAICLQNPGTTTYVRGL